MQAQETKQELLDIEEGLIAGLMFNRFEEAGNVWQTSELRTLAPGDFWSGRNRWLFEVIRSLVDAGKPCDFLSVALEMKRTQPKRYETLMPGHIDGQNYFYSLVHKYRDYALSYFHLKWYARLIKEASEQRQSGKAAAPPKIRGVAL